LKGFLQPKRRLKYVLHCWPQRKILADDQLMTLFSGEGELWRRSRALYGNLESGAGRLSSIVVEGSANATAGLSLVQDPWAPDDVLA
jgi:hypothetical protein